MKTYGIRQSRRGVGRALGSLEDATDSRFGGLAHWRDRYQDGHVETQAKLR